MTNAKRSSGRPSVSDGPAIDPDHLLAQATRAFARQGYEGMSVRALTRQLGITHRLVHYYYATKLDLWKACVDRGFGTMAREMGTSLDSAARLDAGAALRAMIIQYVHLSEQFPENSLILLQEAWKGGDRFAYIIEGYFRDFIALARQYFQANVAAGTIVDVPWQTLFTMIFMGGPARYSLQPLVDVMGPSDPASHARAVADIVLNGILPR